MAALKKSSMREQCYIEIKRKIMQQEYDLGEFINIVSLSNELSVSNTPIREALTQLEADGLVVSSPNSKVKVIEFDNKGFVELCQTIRILLTGAYDLCVKEGKLEDLICAMEEKLAHQNELLEQKKYQELINESIAFDKCILDVLGNSRLLSVFNGLSSLLFLIVRTNHQRNEKQRRSNIREHEMILDAIKNKAHDEAKRLLEAHFTKTLYGLDGK